MALVVYASWFAVAAQLLALGICVGLAVLALLAHLTKPAIKRFVAAGILACGLATVAAARAHADDFVITDPCKNLTPSDWEWWMYGCMWP